MPNFPYNYAQYTKCEECGLRLSSAYGIAGKFGGELNLAVWRSIFGTAKLNSPIISLYCYYNHYMKDIFHVDKTFYSPCPNLEGIKDALCNNF